MTGVLDERATVRLHDFGWLTQLRAWTRSESSKWRDRDRKPGADSTPSGGMIRPSEYRLAGTLWHGRKVLVSKDFARIVAVCRSLSFGPESHRIVGVDQGEIPAASGVPHSHLGVGFRGIQTPQNGPWAHQFFRTSSHCCALFQESLCISIVVKAPSSPISVRSPGRSASATTRKPLRSSIGHALRASAPRPPGASRVAEKCARTSVRCALDGM